MRLVPLAERGRVDHDDRVLHDRLRAHELVVAGVVDDVDDPRLARHRLRLARHGLAAPGEVAGVEAAA